LSRRALAKGLIAFAHEIGSSIIAEGVETESELEALRAIGVDKVQGYYLSKPRSLDDFVLVARGAFFEPRRAAGLSARLS
jgi:EAL domain-containing protein (putative c-di-GMP-specific phosphodiesterase class I)